MVVRILDYVRNASTYEEGDAIFSQLLSRIQRGESVELDFAGIPSVPSAFVNGALVRLLEHVSFDVVRERLSFLNSTRQINDLIRRRFDFVTKGPAINVNEDYEVKYWSGELRCTTSELRLAVASVGPAVAAVREWLGNLQRL